MLKASRGHIPALGDPAEEEEQGMSTHSLIPHDHSVHVHIQECLK